MKRKVIPELLDQDLGTPEEIASNLADLGVVNNLLGGTQTTIAMLRRVAARYGCRELSLLDVGAGSGDLPRQAEQSLAAEGIALHFTLLDRMWTHLDADRPSVCGDALQLPFRDGSFDVVGCSLLAHHLEPDELQRFATEALRVCRRAVLINDLIRSRLHLWGAYVGLRGCSRLSRHDGPVSIRRAYTVPEMKRMLRPLPGARVEIATYFLYRMGVVLWKASEPAREVIGPARLGDLRRSRMT